MSNVAAHFTLATVGLPMRKELLVRSLLRLVNARTIDRWAFCDDACANVVIYDPASAPPGAMLAQVRQMGATTCIALVGIDTGIGGKDVLSYPIRAVELAALLDRTSAELAANAGRQSLLTSSTDDDLPAEAPDDFRFGITLHHLIERDSRKLYRFEAAGVSVHVIPAERALLIKQPLDDAALHALLQAKSDLRVGIVPEHEARLLIADGARPQPIDGLLWRAGLEGPSDRLISILPAGASFALRRWPDFGRLKHDHRHLRMAARLTRAALTLDELSDSSGCPIDQARAFLNACALCDLIKVRQREFVPHTALAYRKVPAFAAPTHTRYGGIFRSIRLALGIGSP